ncbi:hypothetical protein ACVWZL_003327 [Bradyrhizobium sp. GM2.4]
MLTAITAWLADQGAGLILGALSKLALDAWNSYQANQAQRDLAKAQVQLDQGNATIAAQQAELQAQEDAPASINEGPQATGGRLGMTTMTCTGLVFIVAQLTCTDASPTPAAVCPPVRTWSAAFQKQVAAEIRTAPDGALAQVVMQAIRDRDVARACARAKRR